VRLEESARKQNVRASDEPELQFYQPDEAITEETIIADDRVATPEQIVGSDEMMHLIASALLDVTPASARPSSCTRSKVSASTKSRITGVRRNLCLSSIAAARDHLRQSPGFVRQFKGRSPPSAGLNQSQLKGVGPRMITREQVMN